MRPEMTRDGPIAGVCVDHPADQRGDEQRDRKGQHAPGQQRLAKD